MSMNFTANQFEAEYKASKLRNWEIPKWYPERPCGNKGKTKVVSNEKGHLLPGVPRSFTSPWGNFVGTWDLPNKISREEAFKLSAPTLDKIQKWRRHCQQQGCPPPPIPQITTSSKKSREAIAKQEALIRQEAAAARQRAEAAQAQEQKSEPVERVDKQKKDDRSHVTQHTKQRPCGSSQQENAEKNLEEAQDTQSVDSKERPQVQQRKPCPIHDIPT